MIILSSEVAALIFYMLRLFSIWQNAAQDSAADRRLKIFLSSLAWIGFTSAVVATNAVLLA